MTAATVVSKSNNPNQSLRIPLPRANTFLEIFSDELAEVAPDTIIEILKEENACLQIYLECAALGSLYNFEFCKKVLSTALEQFDGPETVSAHAALGVICCALSNATSVEQEDLSSTLRTDTEKFLSQAQKLNQFYPGVWLGKGLFNLSTGNYAQAKFFFDTTLKQRQYGTAVASGPTNLFLLPALLGMGVTHYYLSEHGEAMKYFSQALQQYCNDQTHINVRSNIMLLFGLNCYKLGQIDRAIASFQRSLYYNKENTLSLVGLSVCRLGGVGLEEVLQGSSMDARKSLTSILQTLSLANILDPNNATCQLLLADHYLWKWGLVEGVTVSNIAVSDKPDLGKSKLILDSPNRQLNVGDHVKVGNVDTLISEIDESDSSVVYVEDILPATDSGLELYKKDYDRVEDLTKSAYMSSQSEIKADALTILGKCMHSKRQYKNAFRCYSSAIEAGVSNGSATALWGVVQCCIAREMYPEAEANLKKLLERQVLGQYWEIHALHALLMAANPKKSFDVIKSSLVKAKEYVTRNWEFSLLEADIYALRGMSDEYALSAYKRALELIGIKDESENVVPFLNKQRMFEILTNMGVLSHQLAQYNDALYYYKWALKHSINEHMPAEDSDAVEVVEEENEIFQNLTSVNANIITLIFNIARVHEDSKKINAARELYHTILRIHPTYTNAHLRLAIISREMGDFKECTLWLQRAVKVGSNSEVLTLVGNLHLSLADWGPAQSVFDGLLASKDSKVEAYSLLSLGNIYFHNLAAPGKYQKHLQHASDYYRRILTKDNTNMYAAAGLGTVLGEKGELERAKQVFNRVREVSGDSIPDTLLNLGHIYLAQSKHPEALQMYQSYFERVCSVDSNINSTTQATSSEVLQYIAFAYFDWARQTEAINNSKAAAADERYVNAIRFLKQAIESDARANKDSIVLNYNLSMVKLQFANCVLRKLGRNIRRTAQEVEVARNDLTEALEVVEDIHNKKSKGVKVPMGNTVLTNFIKMCKSNIETAEKHLVEDKQREAENQELRDRQKLEADIAAKEKEARLAEEEEKKAKEQEEREKKAAAKMEHVASKVEEWKQKEEIRKVKAGKKKKGEAANDDVGGIFEDGGSDDDSPKPNTSQLFDDSDDDEDGDKEKDLSAGSDTLKDEKQNEKPYVVVAGVDNNNEKKSSLNQSDLFGSDDESDQDEETPVVKTKNATSEKDLFGDDSDSDEEMFEGENEAPVAKKRRIVEDDEESE